MRLVDADTLDVYNDEDLISSLNTEQQNLVVDFIDAAPTIDAEPVVHAHWKNRKYRGIASSEWFNEWNCSKCGGSGCIRDKYCKHCGAKMDEEV